MAFDYRAPHVEDALSLQELDLYHLLMAYRAENDLDPIPLSVGLTTTAGRHAADTAYNFWAEGRDHVDTPNANAHSWSDMPYIVENGAHQNPSVMWDAPNRVNSGYTSNGYEITVFGGASIQATLALWQGSPGHDDVILNNGPWAALEFNAIGIGVIQDPSVGGRYGGSVFHVWFGTGTDKNGAPVLMGSLDDDELTGTAFGDTMKGKRGADVLWGADGNDTIRAGNGADQVRAGAGDDLVYGGNGRDDVDLGDGHDHYTDVSQIGDRAQDTISGGAGNDRIFTGGGRDLINGGTGSDTLAGGRGGDTITGGEGEDVFVFVAQRFGRDVVTDWDDELVILGASEALTEAALQAALRQTPNGVLYDHLGDGANTILFQDVALDDLDLGAFRLDGTAPV